MHFSKIHNYLIENFSALVYVILLFLSGALVLGSVIFAFQAVVVLLAGLYSDIFLYLALSPACFYTAFGILKNLGKNPIS